MGIGNLFSLLDKLLSKLPIQDRWERIRNRLNKLKQEEKDLLKGKYNEKKAKRLHAVRNGMSKCIVLLQNRS